MSLESTKCADLEKLRSDNIVLREALTKLSNELIAAGATKPQDWHSDNEKRSFVIMTRMGQYGKEALARTLFD